MADGRVRRQNRRFDRGAISVREDSIERNVNDVSVIQLNSIDFGCIGESIERPSYFFFQVSESIYCSSDRYFVQKTPRPIDKQANVFVKFDVRRKSHYAIVSVRRFSTSSLSNQPPSANIMRHSSLM